MLVTGAGGFLGQYIVEQLVAAGEEVRTFARGDYPQLAQCGAEVIRGDVQDAEAVSQACRDVEVVYHVAALAGIWGKWKDYYGINVLGTQNIIDACKKHGVAKLVYTSSPSVTFAGKDQVGVDETTPYPKKFLAYYPRTKAAAEQLVLEANNNDTLLTCALRPHIIWGPRDRHLLPRLIRRAQKGQLRRVGAGNNLIDTIYVENAATAHLQAAAAMTPHSPVCGTAYYLSQDEPVNCWGWINQVLEMRGLPPIKKSISFSSAWHAGAFLESMYWLLRLPGEPPVTRFLAGQLATSHHFDISAARRDFGYEPVVSIAEGMQRVKQAWDEEA